jgi:hypothetical protein
MNPSRGWLAVVVALAFTPATVGAQTVLIRAVSGETSAPLFGALAYLVDPAGETVKNALTDERGRALFVGIPSASYRVRVEMIGMATSETEVFAVTEGMSISKQLRLESSAIQLAGIEVELEGGRCRLRSDEGGLAVADVWAEARKALSAAAFTDQQGAYRFETMTYNRRLDRDHKIISEEESRRDAYMRTPFESRSAEELAESGYVQDEGRDKIYFAPDASVLLSDVFLDAHCFRLSMGEGETEGLIGLTFEPTGENKRVIDIEGSMWIDAVTAELRWIDFYYKYLDPDITSRDVGGRVDFRRLPSGAWIVPEWWIRMPAVAQSFDETGFQRLTVSGFHLTGGVVLAIREAGGRSLGGSVATGGVEGVVFDSLGMFRRGLSVGVVGSPQKVFTNAEGRYSITGLNPGRYQIQIDDAELGAYGFSPEPAVRDVIRGEMTTLDIHLPSVGDVLFDACRGESRPEGSAVLVGTVRDPNRAPIEGATVRVRWTEYRIGPGDLRGETSGFEVTTDQDGLYRFCSVPADMTLSVSGVFGERESEVYETQISIDERAGLQAIEIGANEGS